MRCLSCLNGSIGRLNMPKACPYRGKARTYIRISALLVVVVRHAAEDGEGAVQLLGKE